MLRILFKLWTAFVSADTIAKLSFGRVGEYVHGTFNLYRTQNLVLSAIYLIQWTVNWVFKKKRCFPTITILMLENIKKICCDSWWIFCFQIWLKCISFLFHFQVYCCFWEQWVCFQHFACQSTTEWPISNPHEPKLSAIVFIMPPSLLSWKRGIIWHLGFMCAEIILPWTIKCLN